MSTKMLIDASHPEETRVSVVKGNKVEEFDFESQNRKQIRGNIYLAKVTRVEPSLQAAFIEYGGNRHGFLAFSEIHPDYYQIPLADRQALLREEAEAAAEEDDAADAEASEEASEANASDEEATAPAPKRRRRSRRRTKAADSDTSNDADANSDDDDDDAQAVDAGSSTNESEADGVESDESPDSNDAPRTVAAENETETVSEPAGEGAEEKPKRRRVRRKAASSEEDVAAEATEEAPPKRKRVTKRKAAADPAQDGETPPAEEESAEAKPKRRTRRSAKPKEAEEESTTPEAEAVAESKTETKIDSEAEANEDTKPRPKRRSRRKKVEEPSEETVATDADGDAGSADTKDGETSEGEPPADAAKDEEKPARRQRRSRARKTAEPDSEADASNDAEETGAADALEEVPVRKPKRRHYKIQEVVKRRQIMLVQVVKEERGNKGAALTTYLSLAGRYSVLMPNTARGGGISRKITSAADRKKLKEIASSLEVSEGMGVILRTAGADRTRSEITRDFEYLLRLWENVRTLTLKSTAPCLVYEEGSLIKRSIRDLFDKDTNEIIVAGRKGYEEARSFMEMLEPEQTRNVRLYEGRTPLFAKMGVEAQLDNMLQPQVTLKSGGYLVINQTEALVAIDVNSGKSTKQHSIEDTAYQTNLEAADEVARQLRLRDLAGLIVIDFIDMDERRNNRNVEKRMKDALKNDRARIQVGRISHFGLMEMSRQRMRASVLESATEACPTCAGLGYVRSPSSVSIHVLRAIEEHLLRASKHDITVRTRLRTALYLLNHKRSSIDDLEARFGVTITIDADDTIGQSHHAIERGEPASARVVNESHVQVDSIQPDELQEDGPTEEAVETVEPEGEDSVGSKRRRRGRRGGRKPRGAEGETETTTSENASEENVEAVEAAPAKADEAEAQDDAEQAPVDEALKPTKRTRRRKTASAAKAEPDEKADESDEPKGEAAEAGSAGDADTAPSEGAAQPKRRSTSRPRRKKAEDAIGEAAIHSTADAVLEGEVGTPIDAAASKEPPRPARRRTSRVAQSSATNTEAPQVGEGADADEPVEKKGWLKRTFFPD